MELDNITFAAISEGGFDYKKVYLYAAAYRGHFYYGIGGTPDLAKHDASNKFAKNADHLSIKQDNYLQYFLEDFIQENYDVKIDDKCVIEEDKPDKNFNVLCEFQLILLKLYVQAYYLLSKRTF